MPNIVERNLLDWGTNRLVIRSVDEQAILEALEVSKEESKL